MAAFRPFPKLPPEIRLIIWTLSIQPRSIEIHSETRRHGKIIADTLFATSNPIIPPILHVCRESRIEGLKYYDVIPRVQHVRQRYAATPRAQQVHQHRGGINEKLIPLKNIYINYETDIICPKYAKRWPDTPETDARTLRFLQAEKVQKLALGRTRDFQHFMENSNGQNKSRDEQLGVWQKGSEAFGGLREVIVCGAAILWLQEEELGCPIAKDLKAITAAASSPGWSMPAGQVMEGFLVAEVCPGRIGLLMIWSEGVRQWVALKKPI